MDDWLMGILCMIVGVGEFMIIFFGCVRFVVWCFGFVCGKFGGIGGFCRGFSLKDLFGGGIWGVNGFFFGGCMCGCYCGGEGWGGGIFFWWLCIRIEWWYCNC